MSFEPVSVIKSKTLVLNQDNIDTDQIIPGRFLTATEREGMGKGLFYDWRFNEDGSLNEASPLNAPDAKDCKILVGGANMGCGSSREHAPWALLDFGFKAVISSDIADIFKSNSLKNGLVPVEIDEETHQYLLETPGIEIEVDLERQEVRLSNGRVAKFSVEPFARQCLLDGVDTLGALLQRSDAIDAFEAR